MGGVHTELTLPGDARLRGEPPTSSGRTFRILWDPSFGESLHIVPRAEVSPALQTYSARKDR